ncbi:beta-1,3-glucan-binding protein-like [Uranotaenia lowii]|uniref:beta-1,3-glucan-binding protein-like n=1 Tax=Uranotaenia lowii TaxID=190385 RepID=UPI00247938CB|nr:beta-1,3-glucan-binding protein-like [Uranotaenia lowii]
MKIVIAVACLLVALCSAEEASSRCDASLTTASGSKALPGPYCSGDLIFEDNFNEFNLETWEHERTLGGGGNWEFQAYENNRANSFCENGILNIRPTYLADDTGDAFLSSGTWSLHGAQPADVCTGQSFFGCERVGNANNFLNPIRSARIRTVDSFNFKYGRMEVRARMPTGDWLWPAVWLLPKVQAYGTWPASGEIDLVESRGNLDLRLDGVHIGNQQVGSTLHFGPNPNQNGYATTVSYTNNNSGFNNAFHNYGLEWTPDHITFTVDGQVLRRIDAGSGFWDRGNFQTSSPRSENPWVNRPAMAPFDQEFYILINLAVGGTNGFFPDAAINGNRGKPWSNTSPTAARDFWNGRGFWQPTWNTSRGGSSSFLVDYVRVWAL